LAQRERELQEANNKLLEMSRTDVLTQVDNRRSLEERLEEQWIHAQRLHEPLAVLMCDIDNFKEVNDEYGHPAGDEVLKQFALLLKGAARQIDRVGRYGGEEFLIILSGTVLDAAVTVAERLRSEVELHTFICSGNGLSNKPGHEGEQVVEIRRTVSCGVAAWPHPRVYSVHTLLQAADNALYVAKETGRNRVIRFDGQEYNEHIATKGTKYVT
jgi:diguanylate cyclase (GGDEF)-like protein